MGWQHLSSSSGECLLSLSKRSPRQTCFCVSQKWSSPTTTWLGPVLLIPNKVLVSQVQHSRKCGPLTKSCILKTRIPPWCMSLTEVPGGFFVQGFHPPSVMEMRTYNRSSDTDHIIRREGILIPCEGGSLPHITHNEGCLFDIRHHSSEYVKIREQYLIFFLVYFSTE